MMMKHTLRKGIAMIELIFALVILGITLMSAPMLVSQATTSSTVTFQQESIAMVAAHTDALMTYQWDESNTLPIAAPTRDILRVTPSADTDPELDDGNLINVLRAPQVVYTLPASRRRQISTAGAGVPPPPARFATVALGQDANDNDDVDDFTNNALHLAHAGAANAPNQGEYMDTAVTITPIVTYAKDTTDYAANTIAAPDFAVTPNPTHIKNITTTLISQILPTKQIVLRAFMCNIGNSPNLDERIF